MSALRFRMHCEIFVKPFREKSEEGPKEEYCFPGLASLDTVFFRNKKRSVAACADPL